MSQNCGFKGSFPHFRRIANGKANLVTFQFDKYGGGFVVELANWDEPEYKTSWGKVIPLNKLTAYDLNERQRIYPDSIEEENGRYDWFRYDTESIVEKDKYKELAKRAVERIPLMNQYWEKNSLKHFLG